MNESYICYDVFFFHMYYLDRGRKVKFLPIQVSALSDDCVVGERITQKVDIITSDLAGEYMAILLLPAAKEF